MAKVTLTDLTSLSNDTSAVNSINTNFQTIEDYINDNVLSRDTGAETNTMQNALDMNSNNITNAATIVADDITVNGTNLSTQVDAAAASAVEAAGYASDAADEVTNAAAQVTLATTQATNAATSATNAATSESNVNAALETVDHIIEYVAASGTSFTPDMSEYANFHFTLTGNATISNPDDETVGQSGVIVLIQDGTGSRTITSWGTDFEFPDGTAPTLSTAANAVDIVPYYVYASGRILCGNLLASYA